MEACGHLSLVMGPMFSGKTTEMVRRIRRHTVARQNAIVIKYHRDLRYSGDNIVSTHDGAKWDAVATEHLMEKVDMALEHDVIGIDEGQFFPDLIEFCDKMMEHQKIVIIAALDGDSWRKPYQVITDIISLCDCVDKYQSVCKICTRDAPFTMRTTASTERELIGGEESYMAVCRACYSKHDVQIK